MSMAISASAAAVIPNHKLTERVVRHSFDSARVNSVVAEGMFNS